MKCNGSVFYGSVTCLCLRIKKTGSRFAENSSTVSLCIVTSTFYRIKLIIFRNCVNLLTKELP